MNVTANCTLVRSIIVQTIRHLLKARFLHRKWSCISRTLGDDMLAARCLMLNSHLIDRYFSVHLTTNIGDVKLSTNVQFMEGTASEVHLQPYY